MDYEKKYNEALKWMRELYPGLHGATKEDAEHYFPELHESEDERIRKDLIAVFETIEGSWCGISVKGILSYLEKQKEQKSADLSKMMVHKEPYVAPVPTPMVADEQKPELVQHPPITFTFNSNASRDERLKAALLALLNSDLIKVKEGGYFTKQDLIEWVERIIPTDKPAWSEEDEEMLNSCISSIEEAKENRYAYKETDGDTSYDHEITWLKSLNPQPHWKPSKEQMEALNALLCAGDFSYVGQATKLQELYIELKKL